MTARCLIIDDNPVNLELMVYIVQSFGWDTHSATGGEAGLALTLQLRPDLVLCDVQMPGMDGYGYVQAVKGDAGLRATPVVAVTACAMVGDRDRLLAAGFDGYIAKPIDPMTIADTIAAFVPADRRPKPGGWR